MGTEDTKLVDSGMVVDMIPLTRHVVRDGAEYSFPLNEFHETRVPDLSVTWMVKTSQASPLNSRIACLAEDEPDNEFHREKVPLIEIGPYIATAYQVLKERV